MIIFNDNIVNFLSNDLMYLIKYHNTFYDSPKICKNEHTSFSRKLRDKSISNVHTFILFSDSENFNLFLQILKETEGILLPVYSNVYFICSKLQFSRNDEKSYLLSCIKILGLG